MQNPVVETARIRLREGVSEAELIAASNHFQTAFLDAQPGFDASSATDTVIFVEVPHLFPAKHQQA